MFPNYARKICLLFIFSWHVTYGRSVTEIPNITSLSTSNSNEYSIVNINKSAETIAYIRVGDIIVPKEHENNATGHIKTVLSDPKYRWPKGVVPYKIHRSLAKKKKTIISAMNEFTTKTTCITFKPRKSEKNYILFIKGDEATDCSTAIGMQGNGTQLVTVVDHCSSFGGILHLLGHVIGFYDEHQRSDRDKHIIIILKNVIEGQEGLFNKLKSDKNILYTKYDPTSIMQNGEYMASLQPGALKTMTSKNKSIKLLDPSETAKLSKADVLRARKAYEKLFDKPHVFITLSSTAGTEGVGQWHDQEMELNWVNFVHNAGDWVGLFNYDPSTRSTPNTLEALVAVPVNDTASAKGYYKTIERFDRPPINSDNSGDNCLGYWIGYVRENETLVAVNCFRKYPRWMNDLKSIIGSKPLSNLMIPGTHDAGAIHEYDGIDSETLMVRFSATQEEQLYRQFIHGIRYVDIRVAYYSGTKKKFWINHDSARFQPLVTLFNAIKKFVTETNEIIFMDYHEFPVGFDDITTHDLLLEFVLAEMGGFLVSRNQVPNNPTANDLWAVNRTVILTYENREVQEVHDFLWPYLIHGWGNKNTVEPLEEYFQNEALPKYGCKGIWWSAMAEMTPTTTDVNLNPLLGLREFAQMINIPLTYWWQREVWYSRSMIVSTDFFLGNNIIEMSVWVNQNNGVCPSN